MELGKLLDRVIDSDRDQWYQIDGGGPSYANNFIERTQYLLQVNSHHTRTVYKPNSSITMAWGMSVSSDQDEKFQGEWAKIFPDPSASHHWVDVFFNNALVFRTSYVTVDGGRAHLPLPKYAANGELRVPKRYYEFMQLLNGTDYEVKFKQSRIALTDEPWPYEI